MNTADIAVRLDKISKIADDGEAAHIVEDELYVDLLRAIADGSCINPAICAGKALESRKFDFQRWCA